MATHYSDGTEIGGAVGLPEKASAPSPVTPPAAPAPSTIPEHGPMPGVDDLGRRIVDDASLDASTMQELADQWGSGAAVDDARLNTARHMGRALNQASAGVLDQLLQSTDLGSGAQSVIFLEELGRALADIDPLVVASIPIDRRESAFWALDFMDRRMNGALRPALTAAGVDQDPRALTLFASIADQLGGRTPVGGASPVLVQRQIDAIMSDQKFLTGQYPKAEHERLTAKLRDLYGLLHG